MKSTHDQEDDMYMAGSPGMGSLGSGALGANTNRGTTTLDPEYHRDRMEKIKAHMAKNNNTSLPDDYSEKSKVTVPKGLAEKVRRNMKK